MIKVDNGWQDFLDSQYNSDYYQSLRRFLAAEYKTQTVFPAADKIFSAFKATPPENIKVVILGQDPYHQPGQAHGMAFSVMPGTMPPPSLKNMFKEIEDCYPESAGNFTGGGYLMPWADQGVFLLNACLTVRMNCANSHAGRGWETLTDNAISYINTLDQPVCYLLWGRNARAKRPLINNPRHLVLEAAHPSPLSAYNGFFGCRHFLKANEFLESSGISPINWVI